MMIKIDREKIFEVKDAISNLMEKKSELEYQISDFKQSINDIKSKKKKIKRIINQTKGNVTKNRVKRRVEEKRNGCV